MFVKESDHACRRFLSGGSSICVYVMSLNKLSGFTQVPFGTPLPLPFQRVFISLANYPQCTCHLAMKNGNINNFLLLVLNRGHGRATLCQTFITRGEKFSVASACIII